MPKQDGTVLMEGVQLVFKNFAGKEGRYNREGDRNFAVVLPTEQALQMQADGWNVKQFKERDDAEEGEIPDYWLGVSVGYGKGRPPQIVMISSRGRTNLTEETVEMLDWVDMQNVDLIVRPYTWEVNGNTGVKAYLKSLYVTIEEDELELKYNGMDAQ